MKATITVLQQAIVEFESSNLSIFKPHSQFYEKLKINPKRFWQLVKGTKQPTPIEIKALSDYFKIPQTDFLIH